MLDEKDITGLIEQLRVRAKADPSAAKDVVWLLKSSFTDEKDEPAEEIAKTLCEILEPERIGGIHWLTCRSCGERLDEYQRSDDGFCTACSLKW